MDVGVIKILRERFQKKGAITITVEGNIGCGKSTFLSYLAGNELITTIPV